MAFCSNCGSQLDGYTCRNCGAMQVTPSANQPTAPNQPTMAYYGSQPGYPAGYPPQAPPPPPSKSMLPLILGLVAAFVLVVGGIGLFIALSGDDGDDTASASATTSEEASAEPTDSPTPKPTATRTKTAQPEPAATVTVTKKPNPTVTVTKRADPVPEPVDTPEQESSARDCGNDIWADGTASCPFAGNVVQAYYDSGGASTLYGVYSPVTGEYYDVDCWGVNPVTCQTGRAIIFFY